MEIEFRFLCAKCGIIPEIEAGPESEIVAAKQDLWLSGRASWEPNEVVENERGTKLPILYHKDCGQAVSIRIAKIHKA